MEHDWKVNLLTLAGHRPQQGLGVQPASESVVIAPLADSDIDEMVEIIRNNLNPFEEAGSVLAAAHRRLQQFRQVYSAAGSVYITVKDQKGSRLIGGAGIGPFAGLSPTEGIGEIRELVIDPPYRGQGLGAKLIQSCLFWADKFAYKRIYLETTPQMENAQKLFRRFKFRAVTQQRPGLVESDNPKRLPCYFMLERQDN